VKPKPVEETAPSSQQGAGFLTGAVSFGAVLVVIASNFVVSALVFFLGSNAATIFTNDWNTAVWSGFGCGVIVAASWTTVVLKPRGLYVWLYGGGLALIIGSILPLYVIAQVIIGIPDN